MKKINRPLKAEEVEIRIGTINEEGVTFLLYKNARIDRKILTDNYNNLWQSKFEVKDGVTYCTISVYDEELKQWISREDCGIESMQKDDNKIKAKASDAFKRAAFQFGIGEELYSVKNLYLKNCTEKKERKGQTYFNLKNDYKYLYVKELEYKDNNIVKVVCENKSKLITFTKNNYNYFDSKVENKQEINNNKQEINNNKQEINNNKQEVNNNKQEINNNKQSSIYTVESIKNIIKEFKFDIEYNIKDIDYCAEKIKQSGDDIKWVIKATAKDGAIQEYYINTDLRLKKYIEHILKNGRIVL